LEDAKVLCEYPSEYQSAPGARSQYSRNGLLTCVGAAVLHCSDLTTSVCMVNVRDCQTFHHSDIVMSIKPVLSLSTLVMSICVSFNQMADWETALGHILTRMCEKYGLKNL